MLPRKDDFGYLQIIVFKIAEEFPVRGVLFGKVGNGCNNNIELRSFEMVLGVILREMLPKILFHGLSLLHRPVVLDDPHLGTKLLEFPDPVR